MNYFLSINIFKKLTYHLIFLLGYIFLFTIACKKLERSNPKDGIVGVTTSEVILVDLSTVQITSTLNSIEGVSRVTQRGICWSKNPNPTNSDNFVDSGSGFGTFTCIIKGLEVNTKYYFRSFASNEKTTAYGNEVSYIINGPVITTKAASEVSYTSAKVGCLLVSDGGYSNVKQGICWGEFPNIDTLVNKIYADTKDFNYTISGLENGKAYYYKAFAITNSGIVFGSELNFNTLGSNTPSLTTKSVINIGVYTAASGGEITNDGGLSITSKGVCWSKSSNPTINDNKSSDGSGSGSYSSQLTGLEKGTTYYVRAYATNSKGTSYGNEVIFNTYLESVPTLSTIGITNIKVSSASSGGTISSDGGLPINAKGVCWNTFSNPTTKDYKTSDGSGTTNYSSQLTGLQEGTTYYVRSYATNSKGTSYGDEVSFKTYIASTPTISTTGISNIKISSALCGGTISDDGGLPITSKGICWSTSNIPTINDNKTSEGSGSDSYTSKMSGLIAGVTYNVRAYATNAKGTSYGNVINFRALSMGSTSTISDIDGNTYKTVYIGFQNWMTENLKTTRYNDGSSIPNITYNSQWVTLSGAWAYYNNDATNNAKFGKLYNWHVIDSATNQNKNVCPTGWHVPSVPELMVLFDYLGGYNVAGGKMKEIGTVNWKSPNTDATNSSLFTGLPGGRRTENGIYTEVGENGYWWSSTEYLTYSSTLLRLGNGGGGAEWFDIRKETGLSIRCLQD